MKQIDLVIILGGDVDANGVLSRETINRLDGFLARRYEFLNVPILLSGRCGGFAKEKQVKGVRYL